MIGGPSVCIRFGIVFIDGLIGGPGGGLLFTGGGLIGGPFIGGPGGGLVLIGGFIGGPFIGGPGGGLLLIGGFIGGPFIEGKGNPFTIEGGLLKAGFPKGGGPLGIDALGIKLPLGFILGTKPGDGAFYGPKVKITSNFCKFPS